MCLVGTVRFVHGFFFDATWDVVMVMHAANMPAEKPWLFKIMLRSEHPNVPIDNRLADITSAANWIGVMPSHPVTVFHIW
jgi:hypothetical protein